MKVYMQRTKTISVKEELVETAKRIVETGRYQSLSEFVSEAIRLRLDELKQRYGKVAEKQAEYSVIRENARGREIDSVVYRIFRSKRSFNPEQSALIPILQDVQKELGYLPQRALGRVSTLLKIPSSHVYGVATFYHQFRLIPEGEHTITICKGTACHVAGSSSICDLLMRHLRIVPPFDTSHDRLFTIRIVRCIGACSLAPVMKIDDDVYGRLNTKRILKILAKYRRLRMRAKNELHG